MAYTALRVNHMKLHMIRPTWYTNRDKSLFIEGVLTFLISLVNYVTASTPTYLTELRNNSEVVSLFIYSLYI